jgi:hypothetical protein
MSPKKLLFCYHLPTRGRVGVKLGDAWYVSNVSIIFDAPCLFIHHLLCVLLHFVAFLCIFQNQPINETPQCQFPVSAIFVFQKSSRGNILRIGRNKSQSSYFSWSVTESKAEMEGCQEAAAVPHGAGHPLAVPGCGVGPWSTSWRRPSTYIFPSMGKPKTPDQFSMRHTASHRHRRREIGRVQKLFLAPCRRGESPSEAFFITMPASRVMCE